MKIDGNNFLVRTVSGIVFAAIIIGITLWAGFLLPVLMAVICIGSMYEFYKMAVAAGLKPMSYYGIALGALFVAANSLVIAGCLAPRILLLFLPLTFIFFIAEMYRKTETPIANIGAGIMGIIYVAIPTSLYLWIVTDSETMAYSRGVALSYFIIIWANDVGAYLVGSAIGKHRLFERISPKKSWEGFFGGLLFAVGAAFAVSAIFSMDTLICVLLALVIAVTGVLGDLVESMFKRSAGIKDSGKMMPGHGGFLDRFDSFLISLPFAAVLLLLLG